jgi:hypothetical protein
MAVLVAFGSQILTAAIQRRSFSGRWTGNLVLGWRLLFGRALRADTPVSLTSLTKLAEKKETLIEALCR